MTDIDGIRLVFTGDASGLEATINGISKSLSDLEGKAAKGAGATDKLEKSAKKVTNAYAQTGKRIKETGEAIDDITKPVQAVSVALAAGGVAAAKFAIDFEDNFAAVKKTVEGTPEQLEAVKKSIIDMSTVGINGHSAIPLTTAQLTELAAAGGQLGIATENITNFTETMAMLGTATNLQGEQGAATLARFMNVANVAEGDIDRLGSSIVDLGNNFATTEAEIADMALNMGATGEVVGMSPQDILAYSTALSSLGVEAAAGGSAVSRIWMDIQTAVSTGGKALNKFAKLSGKSSAEFKSQWQSNASGAFRDFLKGLNESKDVVGVLSDLGFNNIRDIQALQRLAGEKGFKLLTDAIERSNKAWSENNALLTEFEAKAETTASQIQVTKNNLVETARSIGETMMPTIAEWSGGVADFAKGLAGMSDSTKETLVKTAAGFVVLGAASKGVVGTMKTVGSITEAVGKLTGGKGIKAIGTALMALPAPAKAAAVGIVTVGVAAKGAKAIYDDWYDSQYRWSEGLSQSDEKIKNSLESYKKISAIQGEIRDLKLIIENPESSKKDVQNAKDKIEEIKTLLSEKYNLVIKSDNSNLDEAVENARKKSGAELKKEITSELNVMNGLAPQVDEFKSKRTEMETEINALKQSITNIDGIVADMDYIKASYNNPMPGDEGFSEYRKELEALAAQSGMTVEQLEALPTKLSLLNTQLGDSEGKYNDLEGSFKQFQAAAESGANKLTEFIEVSAKAGDNDAVISGLEDMGEFIRLAELDMSGYAQAASEAMNGIKLDEAIKKAWEGDGVALNNIIGDYIESMNAFGASAEETAVGAALLKNGFRSIGEAAQNGALDTVIAQANEIAKTFETPTEGEITITATYDGEKKIDAALADQKELQDKHVVYTVEYKQIGEKPTRNAKGTQSFSGGLAMVNDQEGISDPRELIIDKGRAFIPQGKNVILPLSKGAKVYTASQTKAIMRGLGIPHYAKGKSNSDAFVAAKDNWTHYTSTHAVTVTEELQKWVELSEQFNANEKDRMDIAEKIFDLQRKQTEELNKQSLAYIKDRAALNDWTTHGDDPLAAYDRIKERNRQMLEDGKLTWDEYTENVNEAGEALYDGRISQSEKWLDRELKYGRISQAEYRAGLDRMRAYTQEYYDNKLISHREYVESMQELDDKYQDSVIDENREKADEAYKKADTFLENRNVYDDWDAWGISEIDFWDGYIDETRKLQKEKIISDEEAWDKITEAERNQFRAREAEVDKMLEDYRAQIDSVNEYYDNLISRKEEARTISDLEEDSADAKRRMAIYEGAVTERGKEAYKQAKEDLENAEHEKEIMRLQQEQNAVIKQMQTAYDEVEKNKKNVAKGMSLGLVNVSGIVESVNDAISKGDNGVVGLLDQLVKYVCSGKLFNMENYSDNRSVTNYFPSGIDMAALAAMVGKEMR